MICEPEFCAAVLECSGGNSIEFNHPEASLLAAAYNADVPFTIHVGIGTDVIDQHPSFSGEAKGGCSGRDFLIFTEEIAHMTEGGVILNIGSAVTGPEVVLKAVSMAANKGRTPDKIVCADFDIRPYKPASMTDESSEGYYFRDQKSIVTRIPDSFGGKGMYIQGNQKVTVPYLYRKLVNSIQ
jgi:hypothetical protein